MASSSERGPPLNECVNCIVFGWKQPKNPTKVLKTCGTCKLMKYCSQECQSEHWHLVHRKHCKDLAMASTYVHDSSTCPFCTDTKNPNRSKKVCFAKMEGFEDSGLITPHSHHPFPLEGLPGDQSEALIILMQRILLEMKSSKPKHSVYICAIASEQMKQLEEGMEDARSQIWCQRKVHPAKDKTPLFEICGQLFGDTQNLCHNLLVKDLDDPDGLWSSLRLVWSILIDQHITLCVENFKEPDQSWPSVDDSIQFKAMVDQLCKVNGKIPPFPKFLEIFCGGSLSQKCSTCNKSITVARVSGQMDFQGRGQMDLQDGGGKGQTMIAFHGVATVYARSFRSRIFSCNTSKKCAEKGMFHSWYDQWTVAVDDQHVRLATNKCDICFKVAFKVHRCENCCTKQWCSVECRELDWAEGHKNNCKKGAPQRKMARIE